MHPAFTTRVPFRHNRLLIDDDADDTERAKSYVTLVPVRPARIVFQPERDITPRTLSLMEKLCAFDGQRKPIYFPLLFRGSIAGPANEQGDIPVRLSEEPSGRPLEADLPRHWFGDTPIFEGLPFRLFTWIRLEDTKTGRYSAGHRLESLLEKPERSP